MGFQTIWTDILHCKWPTGKTRFASNLQVSTAGTIQRFETRLGPFLAGFWYNHSYDFYPVPELTSIEASWVLGSGDDHWPIRVVIC